MVRKKMGKMELFVALRYLRGKRRIGFISWITYISAAGVFVGSMVLVIALSIANGLEKEVRDRIVGTLAHAKILKYHSTPIENPDSLREIILQNPRVLGAAPYITDKGGIERESVQEGVMIMAVDDSLEQTVTEIAEKVTFGEFNLDTVESDRQRRFPGILIGIGLADKMGIRQGAEVVLYGLVSSDGDGEPTTRVGRFTVSGVFETGMYEYDVNLIYISIKSAQELFNKKGVEGIQIRTSDIFQAGEIAQKVKEELGGYPYRAIDWKAQNKSLFQWMKLERLIIFLVISLIVVVAAFNIFSSLIMMILEKKREIGILMSMGASSGVIMRIFMLNGIVIGFLGSTLGVGLGVLVCWIQLRWQLIPLPGDIYFINKLPVLLRPFDVVAVYISSNLLCWLATLYPSKKAAMMLPAESIRYE
jgi:lipoprotein-releasing system permease protein